MKQEIEYPDEGRDTTAVITYVGERVGIRAVWAFAAGAIDISFVEILKARVWPASISFYPFKDRPTTAKAIRLSTLADVLGKQDDPDFLLKKIDNFRTRNRRIKTIETRMPEVLAGLAHATQTYATPILQGNTSIFPRVMNTYVEKMQIVYSRTDKDYYLYDLDKSS